MNQVSHLNQLYQRVDRASIPVQAAYLIGISWIFALCAQASITLPGIGIPIYPHPLPLFIAVLALREYAMHAYCAYLVQGIMGAPFFSHGRSGIIHLAGPTGGYLVGFLFSMIYFSHAVARKSPRMRTLITCMVIYFGTGLAWLSLFIPASYLINIGLIPFIPGDFFKMFLTLLYWHFLLD